MAPTQSGPSSTTDASVDLAPLIDPMADVDVATNGPRGPVSAAVGEAGGAPASPPAGDDGGEGRLPRQVKVVIVGAGFGGVDAAIQLMAGGEHDFVVIDRAEDAGGCWRANTYPGVACDVPSNLYSYSFAPNPNWTRTYSPGGEIADYVEGVAEEFGVLPHVHFGVAVLGARWIEADAQWEVTTDSGIVRSNFLIGATGPLTDPIYPDIRGRDTFAGAHVHSARWDPSVDFGGKRVAVIGTGASAIQIVPELGKVAAHLDVFQRTAPWVMPRTDRPTTAVERFLFRKVPAAQKLSRQFIYWSREILVAGMRGNRLVRGVLERIGRAHLRRQVSDPELRARLTPDFDIGCKRILLSNAWYPTLTKPHVDVVTDSITEIRPEGVVTADGTLHAVDAIVYATGFHVTDPPTADAIVGRAGETLAEHWHGSPACYLGTAIDDFPNLFMLVGPNSGVGHTSILLSIEWQVRYAVQAIEFAAAQGIRSMSLRRDVMDEWIRDVDALSEGTVWLAGGCSSYYVDATGRNSSTWPTYTWKLRDRLARFDPSAYEVRKTAEQPATARR